VHVVGHEGCAILRASSTRNSYCRFSQLNNLLNEIEQKKSFMRKPEDHFADNDNAKPHVALRIQ